MKKIVIVSMLVILGHSTFAGGGWVYGKNQGYFKLAENVIRSPYFFDGDGEVIDIPTTSIYTTSLYAEYGLGGNWNIIAYLPFFVRATQNKQVFNQSGLENEGFELNSFGDSDVTIKYGFNQEGSVVFAASLTLGIPSGQSEPEGSLQTGDGEFNQLLKLEASHSFYPKPFYVTGFVGFNNRTNNFSEEVRFGGEIGYTSDKFFAILKVKSVQSLNNGGGEASAANTFFGNNIEYFSITPELDYNFTDHIGLSASAGFATSGRNQLASPNFSLGLYCQL